MLLEVERPPRGAGVVLGFLEPLLELPVEELALLGLRLHLLPEALLALRGLAIERAEGGAEVGHGALARRLLVGDHGAELRIDGQLAFAAGADDGERRRSHSVFTLAGRHRARNRHALDARSATPLHSPLVRGAPETNARTRMEETAMRHVAPLLAFTLPA